MNIAFYNGVSGLVSYQYNMDVLSHNIANVNTVGYKAQRTAFSDLLYTKMDVNGEDIRLRGHGVKVQDTDLLYGQGSLVQTQNGLDYALMGEGFFAVECADGSIQYTRNGAFDISLEGSKGYLVTSDDGSYVLDAKNKRIALTRPDRDGTFDLSDIPDRLGIFTFSNPYGLQPDTGSRFDVTPESGEATAVQVKTGEKKPYQIVTGALEQSGANLADQMVNVIVTQKAFQFSAKMVQTADELEEIVNNLR